MILAAILIGCIEQNNIEPSEAAKNYVKKVFDAGLQEVYFSGLPHKCAASLTGIDNYTVYMSKGNLKMEITLKNQNSESVRNWLMTPEGIQYFWGEDSGIINGQPFNRSIPLDITDLSDIESKSLSNQEDFASYGIIKLIKCGRETIPESIFIPPPK